jgi:Lipoxygenase
MPWQDLKSKGLHNMPGVPAAPFADYTDTLYRLNKREDDVKKAFAGLSHQYTIGGHTAAGYDFLIGNPQLRGVFLEDPKQFALSWTTYKTPTMSKSPYDEGMPLLESFAYTLTNPRTATLAFWKTIAQYGTAYNLLILRQVTASRLPELKQLFGQKWSVPGPMDLLQQKGLLYEIDFSMFESNRAYHFHDKVLRHNPATVTLLVREPTPGKENIGVVAPVLIRVWDPGGAEVYSLNDPGWLYALQAAKASVTLYGIWLGHVYHWHIVTAAMQQAMYDTIPDTHPVFKLLKPMSDFLIAFDYALFNKLFLGGVNLFSRIAPPTRAGDADQVLKLFDMFAAGRQFFDDDPKNELAKNGIEQAHFTRDKPWDMYPVARHLLLVWDICERYINAFVSATYPDDGAVAADTAVRAWMRAAADPNQGNIRGLPAMETREALRRVLTSLVYRITIHGVSRLQHTANPELTWVANFPPCLQREDKPRPEDNLSTKELLTYLPNTGTIAEMITFYFAFAFSKPYDSLFPADPGYVFSGKLSDPVNTALLRFRAEMFNFINSEYKWWRKPAAPDYKQWPQNIET